MYLGKELDQGQVKPTEAKLSAIAKFPVPASWKELCRFLWIIIWIFVRTSLLLSDHWHHSSVFSFCGLMNVRMLSKMLKPCYAVFLSLQHRCMEKAFKLEIDASSVGAHAVLIQEDIHGIDHAVCYFSHKLAVVGVAVLRCLFEFKQFANNCIHWSQAFSIFVWSLVVQGYHLVIEHKKGSKNALFKRV